MAAVAEVRFGPGSVLDPDGVPLTSIPSPVKTETLTTPANVGTFAPVTECLRLDGTEGVQVTLGSVPSGVGDFAIELAIDPDVVTAPVTLFTGEASPLSLSLLPDPAGIRVEATVRSGTNDLVVTSSPVTFTAGILMAVGAVVTGDDVVIVAGGATVGRRWRRGLVATAPVTADFTIGSPAAAAGFSGRVGALRIWNSVPPALDPLVQRAADDGVGEIDSKHDQLGGDAGWTGPAVNPEQVVGAMRLREFARATIIWSAVTGVHVVSGDLRARYLAVGGPLGPLGLPTSDETSLAELLDLCRAPHRDHSGLTLHDVLVESGIRVNVSSQLNLAVRDGGARVRRNPQRFDEPHIGVRGRGLEGIGATRVGRFGAALSGQADIGAIIQNATAASPTSFTLDRSVAIDEIATQFGLEVTHDGGVANVSIEAVHEAAAGGELALAEALVVAPETFVSSPVIAEAFTRLGSVSVGELAAEQGAAIGDALGVSSRFDREVQLMGPDGLGFIVYAPRAQRFERGVMVWSAGEGSRELYTEIVTHWLLHGGSDGFLGVPRTSEANVSGGRMATFSGGVIYSSPATGTHEVHGDILRKYLELGGPGGMLGFPLTDEVDVPEIAGARTSLFQNGQILWSSGTGAHEVHGGIRDFYRGNGGPSRYGLPRTDETRWVNGAWEVRYNDFEHGIIAWTPQHGSFDTIDMVLATVKAGAIDDGVEFLSADRDAEMYVFAQVWVDGDKVFGTRVPGSGSAGKNIEFDHTPISFALRRDMAIHLLVEAWDYDKLSSDDRLANHDVTYTFDGNFFGYLSDGGSHADSGSTWNSGDAGAGALKFSYSLAPRFVIDPAQTRRDLWWRFGNFNTAELSYDLYAETFEDVEPSVDTWDDVTNPLDWLYYSTSYKGVAKKGNCFGMSLGAADTLTHRTGFPEPLSARPMDGAAQHLINERHGVQKGAAKILWLLAEQLVPGFLDARAVWGRVNAMTSNGQQALVCMRGKDGNGDSVGHCTLAYRCSIEGDEQWIWVADPNLPWNQDNDDTHSTIRIASNGSFRVMLGATPYTEFQGSAVVLGLLADQYIYDIPLAVVSGPHHTPAWQVLNGLTGGLGGVLTVEGSAGFDQVGTVSGRRLFGDQRRRVLDHFRSGAERVRDAANENVLRAASEPAVVVGDATVDIMSATAPLVSVMRTMSATSLVDLLSSASAEAGGPANFRGAIETFPTEMVLAANDAWSVVDDGAFVGSLGIDPNFRVPWLGATDRVTTPGVWPTMAFIPIEDDRAGTEEMVAHRGPLPNDLTVAIRGRGGQYSHRVLASGAAAGVSGSIGTGGVDTVLLDRLSTNRPGVRVTTTERAKTLDVGLSRQIDELRRTRVGWKVELLASRDGEAELSWTTGRVGATLAHGADAGPVQISWASEDGGRGTGARYTVPAAARSEKVRLRPDDLASPFGTMVAERLQRDTGDVLDLTMIEPTG